MSSILIKNIKSLLQLNKTNKLVVKGLDMDKVASIENAYLFIENGLISGFGTMLDCPEQGNSQVIDATGKFVLPAWCDSHTHLVYAGDRSQEFEDRINGLSYEEIANRGGGILNSADRLANATEEELYTDAFQRLEEIMALGTGAVEIKSGYGLTVAAELKMLRVIAMLKKNHPISIKSTFLGAHAFPKAYENDHDGYIDLIVNEMIPAITKEGLAEYIDVFCEKGYFTVEQTNRILTAGVTHGLIAKTHVNQFNAIGGIEASVNHNALSVDHLEVMADLDYAFLENSNTIPTLLPSCSYFLSIPYGPAKELIAKNIPVALATDFNPGSTPSGNMNFVVSTACIKMKMTPQEAITAATINGAYAMGLSHELGSIGIQKKANIIITNPMNTKAFIPYYFGVNPVNKVILNGQIVVDHSNK
ncbi:MAG: imidazolonepropionase [Salibacteraceae bacterium]|jgi:imidazolonepropionase